MTREEEAAAYGSYYDGTDADEQTSLPQTEPAAEDEIKQCNSAENWGKLSPVTFVQKVNEYSEKCSGTPKSSKSSGEAELLSARGEAAAGALLMHLQQEESDLGEVSF